MGEFYNLSTTLSILIYQSEAPHILLIWINDDRNVIGNQLYPIVLKFFFFNSLILRKKRFDNTKFNYKIIKTPYIIEVVL
jgi:hypothetical protein